MKIKVFFAILFALTILSCSKEKEELPAGIKQGKGTVWLSGGLMFCAEQIRMDSGDTLIIANRTEISPFRSGDRVKVKYQETEQNEKRCNIGIACELIEIEKTN